MNTDHLKTDVSKCRICSENLPFPANPVLQFSGFCRLAIIGQAPGLKAHESNKPWNDLSGVRLRNWLNINDNVFYDEKQVALVPMGFCYPGRGKSGDLPPRKECAKTWHQKIFHHLGNLKLKILIGSYAQNYYLQDKVNLTTRCQTWRNYYPNYLILPHPSPRNNIWLKKNPWFEEEVIPTYRQIIKTALGSE